MFFSNDRNKIRQFFRTSWQKFVDKQPAEPIELIVGEVVSLHPEYHALLEAEEEILDKDYLPENGESNPFLHMGMHITLREQYLSDRPAGINLLYKKILMEAGDAHQTEHLMMDCLGESLWQAQQSGQMPNEARYLDCLRQLIK